jgi:hypothetical protein
MEKQNHSDTPLIYYNINQYIHIQNFRSLVGDSRTVAKLRLK